MGGSYQCFTTFWDKKCLRIYKYWTIRIIVLVIRIKNVVYYHIELKAEQN